MSIKRKMTAAEIDTFFERLHAKNPEPKTELEYHNAFTLLVAVVLSAQATDAGVNKATKALFQQVDTPQQMVDLGLEGLREHIKTIGLYNSKAKNVMKLSEILVSSFEGQVPKTREELESLPGVGRKTANVVLNVLYQLPTMPVDTHLFRLANRTGMAPGKTPLEVENNLLKRIPKKWLSHAHHWLILHGRYYLCRPQTKMHHLPGF